MASDSNNPKPLLGRLNEIENNLNLLAEQVLHPKSEDKIRFFEKKLQAIDELREVIASFQKADELSKQNFSEKLLGVKNQIEGIHRNKEAIFEGKKELNSEIVKLSKSSGEVDRRLEDIDKLKKRVVESEQDMSLDLSKISRKINSVEEIVLKDSKSVFESRKRLDDHFAKTFSRMSEVEEELTVLGIIEKKIGENKKVFDGFVKNSIKKMSSVDLQLKNVDSLKIRVFENEKEDKIQKKKIVDSILEIEKAREALSRNVIIKNEASNMAFGKVNLQLDTLFDKLSKNDLELSKISILDKSLKDNRLSLEKEILKIRNEFQNKADKTHGVFRDKLRGINEELMKISGIRKSVQMSEKNISVQNNDVLEKMRQVDKRSNEVRKSLVKEKMDIDFEFERVEKGVVEINRELKVFRDLGFAVNKIEQRKELDKIKKTAISDRDYFIRDIADINKFFKSMKENLIQLNAFKNMSVEDKSILDKRLLGTDKHLGILDKKVVEIGNLEEVISNNKASFLEKIKIASNDVRRLGVEDRLELESAIAGVNSEIDDLREVVSDNKKIILNDFKMSNREMKQASFNDRKNIEAEILTFSKKINRFAKELGQLDSVKQNIKDDRREEDLAIKVVSDKVDMVEGKLNHLQKYNSSSTGKQKLYEESVLKEILDGLKSNDKKIKEVEKEVGTSHDKVYVRLDEIIELVMFWEKRLNKLENYVNEMDYKRRKSLDDITSSVRKNSAKVEIAKVKKEILSQLKKSHGKK